TMVNGHRAIVAVVYTGVYVERNINGVRHEVDRRAQSELLIDFHAAARGTANTGLHILPIEAPRPLCFSMPRDQIADGHPGRHGGPRLGTMRRHDQGHVPATGDTAEVDAAR